MKIDGSACEPVVGWLVLVFMAGDNNHEAAAVADVAEMLVAAGSSDVDVVVQLDRASSAALPAYSDSPIPGIGDFTDARRFEITQAGALPVGASLLETDTSDPGVLADFLSWGLQTYPARRTALILWNHGAAWRGLGADESNAGSALSLTDISQGISLGLTAAGQTSVDLIGFDASLMASIEVAAEIAPHATVMVASEEIEPADGWDYAAWLPALTTDPDLSPQLLASEIIRTYVAQFGTTAKADGVTLSAVDLTQVPALVQAVDDVASRLPAALVGRSRWLETARSASRSQSFLLGSDGILVRDLGEFLAQLQANMTDAPLAPLLTTALAAYNAAVFDEGSGVGRPGTTGLATYLPLVESNYSQDATAYATSGVYGATAWPSFLDSYHTISATDVTPPTLSFVTPQVQPRSVDVSATVTADDLSELYLVARVRKILPSSELVVGRWPVAADAAGDVTQNYPFVGGYIQYDNQTYPAAPIYDYATWEDATASATDALDKYTGAIVVRVFDGAQWYDGFLGMTVDAVTNDHEIAHVYLDVGGSYTAIDLLPGLILEPQTVDAFLGNILVPSAAPITIRTGGGPMTFGYSSLPAGDDVLIAYEAVDFAGNKRTRSTTGTFPAPGPSCTLHTDCASDQYCNPVSDCQPVYGAIWQLWTLSATVAPTTSGGASWDALGNAPDPYAQWSILGFSLLRSEVITDSYNVAWTTRTNVIFFPGDDLRVDIWDEDGAVDEWVNGILWTDIVALARAGYANFSDPGQLQYFEFYMQPL